jgi:hypothetical protein
VLATTWMARSLVAPLLGECRGYDVSVPGDVEGVLTYRYGKSFMTPR